MVVKSNQIKEVEEGKINAGVDKSKLRMAFFKVVAEEGDTTAELVKLPGKCRVVCGLSNIKHTALGATLNVGYAAYTKVDGTAVEASANGLGAALATSSAGTHALNAGIFVDFEGKSEIKVTAAGTLPANAVLEGYIAYVTD